MKVSFVKGNGQSSGSLVCLLFYLEVPRIGERFSFEGVRYRVLDVEWEPVKQRRLIPGHETGIVDVWEVFVYIEEETNESSR